LFICRGGGSQPQQQAQQQQNQQKNKKVINAWFGDRRRETIQEEREAADHGVKDEKGV
jgi:hypothetical protein